jgi:hypothetical protein
MYRYPEDLHLELVLESMLDGGLKWDESEIISPLFT